MFTISYSEMSYYYFKFRYVKTKHRITATILFVYLRKQPRNCASSECHQSTASISVYSLRGEQHELEANRPI